VGGNALTQVLQGEQRYDLVMRYLPQYRDTKEAIENIRLLSPFRRARLAGAALQDRRARRRFGRSTAKAISATSPSSTACAAAIWAARWKKRSRKVNQQVQLPRGYHIDWEGEYEARSAPRRAC
jgi:heavy metal efflux system protein